MLSSHFLFYHDSDEKLFLTFQSQLPALVITRLCTLTFIEITLELPRSRHHQFYQTTERTSSVYSTLYHADGEISH
jgi:hypothetical protein